MYQLKSLLTACFILLVAQQDILGQQKKKIEPTKSVKNTELETPNNVSVKQSTGPQSNLQGFKANKMSTRNGRFGVPEEIAPDRFGLRGGIGQVILFEGEQSDLIPTFEIGAFANIGFTPRSRFQPELYYQSKATNILDITRHVNMLNVPLLYQYRFGYDAKSFFIEVGPYASYLTSMSYFSASVNNTIDLTGLSFDDRVEMGVVAGAGYRFDKRWFVDLRANYGLKKIKDFNNFATVSLGVGYGF